MAAKSNGHAGRQGHQAYETVALVLQGGGALGAYQAGVVEGLGEAGIEPNWVAGISIGALNAAIIAGNPPRRRVERLREFWQTIARQPLLPTDIVVPTDAAQAWPESLVQAFNGMAAWRALTEGQNGFFVPRPAPWLFGARPTPTTASYYDTSPLRHTLERFADFDRINDTRQMRVSVGAVNVRNGNFEYFDNTEQTLRPEHFIASGALPPGFPAVEIDGEYYWDGGIVSNTPLYQVLMHEPRKDSLVFQVDLWSAEGDPPTDLTEVATRQKDIQYSSRTRMVTTSMERMQVYRRLLREVMELVPPAKRGNAWYRRAAEMACDRRFNIIHLIYKDKPFDGQAKDFQFGMVSLLDHWNTGLQDMRRTLQHPDWLDMPSGEHSFVTHDVHRKQGHDEVAG
ncbi:MAG TPA: patatin-like phospholipase family protein [Bordetella sp.]